MKHTLEPWFKDGLEIVTQNQVLATCDVANDLDESESDSIARLIASAPELLELVKRARSLTMNEIFIRDAEKIIFKATGKYGG